MVELVTEITFEAAHCLPHSPEGHKCRALHGHSYRLEIAIRGEPDPETGWLLDYGDIRRLTDPLRLRLDHSFLNEIEGLENPTSEILVKWMWDFLKPQLPQLFRLTLHETANSQCRYWG